MAATAEMMMATTTTTTTASGRHLITNITDRKTYPRSSLGPKPKHAPHRHLPVRRHAMMAAGRRVDPTAAEVVIVWVEGGLTPTLQADAQEADGTRGTEDPVGVLEATTTMTQMTAFPRLDVDLTKDQLRMVTYARRQTR